MAEIENDAAKKKSWIKLLTFCFSLSSLFLHLKFDFFSWNLHLHFFSLYIVLLYSHFLKKHLIPLLYCQSLLLYIYTQLSGRLATNTTALQVFFPFPLLSITPRLLSLSLCSL